MTPLFKKLNLKHQNPIAILNAPTSFNEESELLSDVVKVDNISQYKTLDFILMFAEKLKDVERFADTIEQKTVGDAVVWLAYPKKSSKIYDSEINRDIDWSVLGDLGFEAVRQISIDKDWSALRFRRVEYIKSMTRDSKRAISSKGKAKVTP